MIDKRRLKPLLCDYESRTYHIYSADELLSDENKYSFIKNFYDEKLSEEEFFKNVYEVGICPTEDMEMECDDFSKKKCTECWRKFLTVIPKKNNNIESEVFIGNSTKYSPTNYTYSYEFKDTNNEDSERKVENNG